MRKAPRPNQMPVELKDLPLAKPTRKGRVVEKVRHPATGLIGAVRLDMRTMTFFARLSDDDPQAKSVEAKDGALVRRWLEYTLGYMSDPDQEMEWIPVIEMSWKGDPVHRWRNTTKEIIGESVEVNAERYYIALSADQREWRKLSWEECNPKSTACVEPAARYAVSDRYADGPKHPDLSPHRKPFRLPNVNEYKSEVVMPHTEELWAGIKMVIEQIASARSVIGDLLQSKEGIRQLSDLSTGQLLLAPPKQKRRKTR